MNIIDKKPLHSAWIKLIRDTRTIGDGIWHNLIFRNGIPCKAIISTGVDTYIFAKNIETEAECELCGNTFKVNRYHPNQKYCSTCQIKKRRINQRKYMRIYRSKGASRNEDV